MLTLRNHKELTILWLIYFQNMNPIYGMLLVYAQAHLQVTFLNDTFYDCVQYILYNQSKRYLIVFGIFNRVECYLMWYSNLIPVRRKQNLDVVLYLEIKEDRLKNTEFSYAPEIPHEAFVNSWLSEKKKEIRDEIKHTYLWMIFSNLHLLKIIFFCSCFFLSLLMISKC